MCPRGKSFSCSEGLLLCFLQIAVVLLQPITCAVNNPRLCSPSSCGKITNISYPFRLKDDPETCGDKRYELGCENNRTVLSLFSGKYYVQAINYNNYAIRLVDPAIQEADCSSIPRYSLSAPNFTSSYNSRYNEDPYKAPSDFLYVVYLNCSNPVVDDPRYVDTDPCLNSHSNGHVYAFVGDLAPTKLEVGCSVKLVAPTSLFSHRWVYVELKTFSYAEIHRMLVYGFDLSWLSAATCEYFCGGQGQQYCYFDEKTENLKCFSSLDVFCTSPLGFGVRCEHLTTQRIFVEDIIFGFAQGLVQIIGRNLSTSINELSDSELGIEIGRVIGRYVVPSYTARFTLGLIVFCVLLIYICRKRHTSMYGDIEDFLQGNTLMPIRYSFKEIKKMTENFKYKLGEGGYGSVYKGKLRSGPFVAIKMLGKAKANGQEFISEVATIGRIHHANVVRLIGFCAEGSKRALVYEFMPNGSLDRYILSKNDSTPLTYEQMYEISLGVARGIAYLHQGCDMQILHFDIKPHNILLDDNFNPKVSDFGLAKLYPIDKSIVTLTNIGGTCGYMAPELFYQNIGGISYKADVYSFGMLLMEMASRRRNLNPNADNSSQLFFPSLIYDQLNEQKEMEMEEVTYEGKNSSVKKMFLVALWCIQLKPTDRPSMNKVIEMLEGDVKSIEMPPKPSLYPTETIQRDLETNSEPSVSDATAYAPS